MFKNITIDPMQTWNGEELHFDPDSSPKAWEHYKKYYMFSDYDFNCLFFYNYQKNGYKSGDKWLNYINKPNKENNRLYALESNATIENDYCAASARLGGETDFNFNEKKVKLFQQIIGSDKDALDKLKKCKKKHHTLVNFSLMQAMGNMQGEKGKNRFDRLDVFVSKLNGYFLGLSKDILNSSSNTNKRYLISFLDQYDNIYDYMKKTYFINAALVDKIIEQGALAIEKKEDVVRYMNLAEEFWNEKESYFLNKELI